MISTIFSVIAIIIVMVGIGISIYSYLNNKTWNRRSTWITIVGSILLLSSRVDIQSMTWGIVPLIVGIAAVIGLLSFCYDNGYDWANFILWFTVVNIMGAVMCALVSLVSYSSYVDVTNFKATQYQQYIDTVTTYEKLISKERGGVNELTDLKFQGFQQSLADMLKTLRWEVIDFNETVADKRTLAKNKLIGFLIFPPGPEVETLSLMGK